MVSSPWPQTSLYLHVPLALRELCVPCTPHAAHEEQRSPKLLSPAKVTEQFSYTLLQMNFLEFVPKACRQYLPLAACCQGFPTLAFLTSLQFPEVKEVGICLFHTFIILSSLFLSWESSKTLVCQLAKTETEIWKSFISQWSLTYKFLFYYLGSQKLNISFFKCVWVSDLEFL